MTEETNLLERIDDVPAFLESAGKYHTTTAHQAYAVLKALSWHPRMKTGEELYFPEGSILFAEVKPITPNVEKVGWGTTDDFYQKRLHEYSHWEVAFWREVVQNSRDSGATRIDLECVEDVFVDPETKDRVNAMRVSVSDNGHGMDYNTMMTAFFRRGGTQKEEGSVGGFGDAKSLILTPWLGYEVRSHDTVVAGRHEEIYADLTKQGLPYHDGTKVTVWMPLAKTTTPEYAQFLIEQSSLDNIRFTVNGARVKGTVPKGKLVQESAIYVKGKKVGSLLVYHSARARRSGIYVRSHGLYTYEKSSGEHDFKGVITIEVNAPPVDVFSTKRNSLDWDSTARADVESILKRLASDPRSTLKAVRDKKHIVFRGTGAMEAMEGRVSEMSAEIAQKADLDRQKRQKSGRIKLDKGTVKVLLDAFIGKADELDSETDDGSAISLPPLPSTFGTLVAQTEFMDVEQIAGAIQISMWKPDFFLYQNISPWKMPKALHPETMQHKYHVLLAVWTEICKFVLVQFGMFEPFGVGWVFDTDYDPAAGGEMVIGAAYSSYDGGNWLLLNPVEIERHGWDENVTFKLTGDRFKLNSAHDVETLVSLAVHEITHMQGFSSHTEAYVGALTDNMQAVFRIAPVLKKIVKEARASVREVRKAAKEAAVKYEWESVGEDMELLIRVGDQKYMGYINRDYEGQPYEGNLVYEPSDTSDMSTQSWGEARSLSAAKKMLEEAAIKKFPPKSAKQRKRETLVEWVQAGPTRWLLKRRSDDKYLGVVDNDYGTAHSTRLAFSPSDSYDFESIWWGDAQSLSGAKDVLEKGAEEKFGFETEPPAEEIVWDDWEGGGGFMYGRRVKDHATVVGVKKLYGPEAVVRDDHLSYVPRAWTEEEGWNEIAEVATLEEAKRRAEELYREMAPSA